MISQTLAPLANHLWQSTLFALAAALLTLALRRNRAHARYCLWLAASLKFLVPFSLLIALGNRVEWRAAPAIAPAISAVDQVSQPFTLWTATPAPHPSFPILPVLLASVWFAGFAIVVSIWIVRLRRVRFAVRAASPLQFDAPIRVVSSPALLEPGVVGIVRPVLLLPDGITSRLSPEQLEAILAHELCHVRRRDNLTAAIHMTIEAIFWFHPLVWWIGSRLLRERENACDEEVLRLGNRPQVYAQGIVNVCRFYLESPVPCASGVTGSDLTRRIETIMTHRILPGLTRTRKLLLATSAIAAIAVPVLVGIAHPQRSRAQSTPTGKLTFDVASIKPAEPGSRNAQLGPMAGGALRVKNLGLKALIGFAYDVRDFQISGASGWIDSDRYDILAKPDHAEGPGDLKQLNESQIMTTIERLRERTRALLADRFQLVIHRESKELQVYALVPAKGGSKLIESKEARPPHMSMTRGRLEGHHSNVQMLTHALSNVLGRTVVDRTGLTGAYDFTMEWTPDSTEPTDETGPSIFTVIQEQLGLKLVSQKGPVEIIVIDRAEKPSAN